MTERRTRNTGGRQHVIPCPAMGRDYHRWMGGVDVHDQLRLQRYSIQLQTWCKKNYKIIFLGLVDVAIVNAYIVFKEAREGNGEKHVSHAEFLLKPPRATPLSVAPTVQGSSTEAFPSLGPGHEYLESPDYQIVKGVWKRQHQCKICSIIKRHIGDRQATKYYCGSCSVSDKARTYLCQKVYEHFPGNTMTCHQNWHYKWENGNKRPRPRCGRDIQSRSAIGTKKKPGKGKRRRPMSNSDENSEEGESTDTNERTADNDGEAEVASSISAEED
ncbi:hypothetical protein PHMEG_00015732 [Phytophthora megakarya]|uniref:PiggyBac transposable element-derived protein domain-containing protein n=1 Tax=Phytophthora megakarya TaxID=4795 RepID=A0A225W2N0_9STRA|nr:hypothetical protein PHMEG_00015732 [Phytophthora megakarya]